MADTATAPPPAPAAAPTPSAAVPPPSSASLPHPASPEADQPKSSSVIKEDAGKPDKWPFAEPQPIREDQVRNAVNFLSHPKVRESPVKNRYAFLEHKGLTRAEIEEAFRRCPDPPTNEATKTVVPSEGKVPSVSTQAQPGGYSQAAVLTQPQPALQYTSGPPSSIVPTRTRSHWSQLIVGAGLIAAAGAGTGYFFQKVLAPKLKTWLRDILLEEDKCKEVKGEGPRKGPKLSPLEEAVASAAGAANAAAAAASEVANTSREVLKLQAEEWQHLRNLMKTLDNKTEELRSNLAVMSKTYMEDYKVAGTIKHYQRNSSPAEQLQMKQGVHGYQSVNGVDRIHSNGQSTNFSSYVSQSEDEPWWRRKKVDVETYSSPKQHAESTIQVSEVEADLDQEIGSTVLRTSTQSRGGLPGRQGWMPPPVPQTVNPAAASAIRYQKPATVDEPIRAAISEGKEVASRQSSPFVQTGLLDSSSSIRLQNPIKADEAKPRVVVEDSANGGDGMPEVAGAEEKEMTARTSYELPMMPEVTEVAEIDKEIPIRLEHPVNLDEANARVFTEDELPKMPEVGKVTEITTVDKEIPSSSIEDWAGDGA